MPLPACDFSVCSHDHSKIEIVVTSTIFPHPPASSWWLFLVTRFGTVSQNLGPFGSDLETCCMFATTSQFLAVRSTSSHERFLFCICIVITDYASRRTVVECQLEIEAVDLKLSWW